MKKIRGIIPFLAAIVLAASGCGQKTPQPASVANEISVDVNKFSAPPEIEDKEVTQMDVKVFVDDEYAYDLDYRTQTDNGEIYVTPKAEYFDLYMNKDRMDINNGEYGPACGMYAYPVVELFIVNNSEETLSISELNVEVEKSRLDDLPYLYFYIDYELSGCMPIMNESWSDWGEMVLDYKLLRSGESFDGKYDRRRVIPRFDGIMLIDFTADLRSMGLDEERLEPYIDYRDLDDEFYKDFFADYNYSMRAEEDKSDFHRHGLFMTDEYSYDDAKQLFYPFNVSEHISSWYGFAWLYGHISFTKHSFTKDIKTQILVTYPGEGGADEGLDDKFDLQLVPDGEHYVRRFPYVTTIAPRGSERVQLRVRCDKSSHHDFIIRAKNSLSSDVVSKKIHFYYLNTPHSYMNEDFSYE